MIYNWVVIITINYQSIKDKYIVKYNIIQDVHLLNKFPINPMNYFCFSNFRTTQSGLLPIKMFIQNYNYFRPTTQTRDTKKPTLVALEKYHNF